MKFKGFSAKILKWLFIQSNKKCLNPNNFNGVKYVKNIKNNISIIRDKWNVPHISAENRNDLFFAQGFIHAQDRLWQLEMCRKIGLGRLSETFGEIGIQTDRLTRTLGFYNTANKDLELLTKKNLDYSKLLLTNIGKYSMSKPYISKLIP